MIKAETDKGAITIEVYGDLSEILADLTIIMTDIYEVLDDDLKETYLNCISECIPNLIRRYVPKEIKRDVVVEAPEPVEEKDDLDAIMQEAADIALKLLRWRNGDDFDITG